MDTVQLSLHNIALASRLEKELKQLPGSQVMLVKTPDLLGNGIIILDEETLDRLPMPLADPQRFVLVTRNETPKLKRAWEQGIVSVMFEHDPPHTVCLATQAALLRLQNPHRNSPRCVITPKGAITAPLIERTAAGPAAPASTGLKNQVI